MTSLRGPLPWIAATILVLGGCATRPINPPITQVDLNRGYRFETRQEHRPGSDTEDLVILAFSGGGTRAAAFSYGVLEALRRMEIVGPKGERVRLLDEVDLITGVSGGSFTALAYGLYGDKLFDIYETSFLKRNVQGELIARVMNPGNWGALGSEAWGRSELAAQLYDEILFHGATFADLDRGSGPFIFVTGTDISTGARIGFSQHDFDYLCSDLDAVPLSRAAAASSAVPFALSPVTINNYGGSCKFVGPAWIEVFKDPATAPRPAARAIRRWQALEAYQDGVQEPYIHVVDGGLADNLGVRSVVQYLEEIEAVHLSGKATPFDHVRRIIVFHLAAISLWAVFYLWAGCMPDAEAAFYFSGVTYTTVGYGDVVLAKPWRLLGPIEGLMGILMFGLSTGFLFSVMSHVYQSWHVQPPAVSTMEREQP